MEHYICIGGCRGVSEKPGVCQASNCPHKDKPLESCECHDGKHHDAFNHLPELEDEPGNTGRLLKNQQKM